MTNDELINQAVWTTIAEQILKGIGTEHRDALLRKSIEHALKDWRTESEIEKVVAAEAARVSTEMIKTDFWQKQIHGKVTEGLNHYLGQLAKAVVPAVVEAMHGHDGDSYSRGPGLIMKHLKRPENK